jgi:hypothetical protein
MKTVKEFLPAWSEKVSKDTLLFPLVVDTFDTEVDNVNEALFVVNLRIANLFHWLALNKPERPN